MVERLYSLTTKIAHLRKNKALGRAFVIVAAFWLGLEIISPFAYAQESEGFVIDATGSYDNGTLIMGSLTDTVGVYDSLDSSNTMMTDSLINAISVLCIECFENSDAVTQNPDIHPFAKVGLVSLIDNANRRMVTSPPTQNVYAHLQTQWLPGETYSGGSVYAQSGYDLLVSTGIDQLWESVRNLSYVVFVIVLIVAGFMMMFRQKIGGQLAVTVFNTIPQVILSLILVTFSFSIVGLILNLSATLTNVAAGILGLSSPADGVTVTGPISIFMDFVTGDIINFAPIGTAFVGSLSTAVVGSILANTAGIAALGAAAPLVAGGVAIVGFIGLLLVIVVLGIVLVGSIKVFITLLKAYVGILIDTILAPLYLTMSALPGRSQMRGDWFRRIVKNALTFTLVFFFLNLSVWLFNANVNLSFPSDLAQGNPGALSGGVGTIPWLLKAIISIYLIYVAAESPKFLDEFLPQTGGKNIAAALQGAAKGAFGKVPVIGNMVGG